MIRVSSGILAAVAGVVLAGSAQATTVLLQDNFDGAVGATIAGWSMVYQQTAGSPTAVYSSTALDSGTSARFSGPGAAWAQTFASPYTVQTGDVVTATIRVQTGSANNTDQFEIILRGTDTSNAGRDYQLTLQGSPYPFMIANNSTGAAYQGGYPAWDGNLGGTSPTNDCWLKMEYTQSTHTLVNSFATSVDPNNWHQFSIDSHLTMASFHEFDIIAGDYGTASTNQSADSLSVVAVSVPEPASIALLGLAVIGLAARRRKA